jgi:hypothetical protein
VTNFTILTAKDWALRWIRGSIESYFIGKTPLEIVKGRIKRAVKSYNVNPKEVGAIVNSVIIDPSLNAPKELREERAKPLIEFLSKLEKGEKSG